MTTRSLLPQAVNEDSDETPVYDNNAEQILIEQAMHLRKISFYLSHMVDFDINNQDLDDL